jgi:hypothetical protein
MGIDWRTIRGVGAGRLINSGIYLGPTRGLSSPKNNRRSCLCLDGKSYSRDCCNGALQEQGVGIVSNPNAQKGLGAFSSGFSDGFDDVNSPHII